MMQPRYKFTPATDKDLPGILALQRENLAINLTEQERREQGFVTVVHSPEMIQTLNETSRHIVARDGEKVIGYTLAMTRKAKDDIPVLVPLFQQFETLVYEGKLLSAYNYIVVGQACVDKAYRGQRVLDQCYDAYREYYAPVYDMAITDIVAGNHRSRRAHQRVGFRELASFTDADGVSWIIVLWDWRKQRPGNPGN